jgi:glycopeptide antibiotics resistance protein
MVRETFSFALFSFVVIVPLAIWMIRTKKKLAQIMIFSTFILYIFAAAAQVCTPINYSGLHILENIKNFPYSESIYILPFKQRYFDIHDTDAILRLVKSYILNIVLTIPFGVLLPLIRKVRTQSMLIISVIVGLSAESLQLGIGLLFGYQFRITHIDDVIMNAIGVMIGYAAIKTVDYYAERIFLRY